jgi:hypothetical protein
LSIEIAPKLIPVLICVRVCMRLAGNLPAFLIGAGVDHYLTIGGWVDDAVSAHWSPLFDRPLGEPLSDGVYDAATATWHRAFRSGTNVSFNARTSTGAIAWG